MCKVNSKNRWPWFFRFFINSLALRTKHNPNYTIKEFIQMVGNEVVEAHAHQDLPFEKLVEELNIEKDITHHPIFDVWFEVQSFGGELYKQSSIENSLTNILEPYRAKFNLHKVAKFDLSVFIEDRGNKLRGIFNYAESLYKEETIDFFSFPHILPILVGHFDGNLHSG